MSDEVKQLNITSLSEKTIQGKDGAFVVWVVNGKWEAGKGKWSGDWKVGGTARGVFKEVTGKTGNVYYKIGCPPDLMPKDRGGFGGGASSEILQTISENILAIRSLLASKFNQATPTTVSTETSPAPADPTPSAEPTSSVEQEINVDDIPF
jgi:hypothetical protein